MINDETKRKLRAMNLSEVICGLDIQKSDPSIIALPFDERFQQLVDYVYQEKNNGKVKRLLTAANLRFPQADRFGIYYDGRSFNKQTIDELMYCEYINNHQSIILQGPTGSGKTYLACALGKQACLQQIGTRYIRMPDLLMEYGDAAVITGQTQKLYKKYSSYPLLILDEWLISEVSDSELYFLFELFERQSDATSTIFCTQYRKEDWIKRLGSGLQAEAILDRFCHTGMWIETGDVNMRQYCATHQI